MTGNAVRPAGERPCDKTSEQAAAPRDAVRENAAKEQTPKKSFTEQFKDKAKGLLGK